jgi:hypothetical protein
MNSCGAAFGVVGGGGGNERFGVIFKNVLNATCLSASFQYILARCNVQLIQGWRGEEG